MEEPKRAAHIAVNDAIPPNGTTAPNGTTVPAVPTEETIPVARLASVVNAPAPSLGATRAVPTTLLEYRPIAGSDGSLPPLIPQPVVWFSAGAMAAGTGVQMAAVFAARDWDPAVGRILTFTFGACLAAVAAAFGGTILLGIMEARSRLARVKLVQRRWTRAFAAGAFFGVTTLAPDAIETWLFHHAPQNFPIHRGLGEAVGIICFFLVPVLSGFWVVSGGTQSNASPDVHRSSF